MREMRGQVRMLSNILGPDTMELQLRIGLHSGKFAFDSSPPLTTE